MQILRNDRELGEPVVNIGRLLLDNAARFADSPAFAERCADGWHYRNWRELGEDVLRLAAFLLRHQHRGGRIAFVSGNCYARHVCELAVMAAGRTSVPIFAGYPAELMGELLRFSDTDLLITDQPDKVLALAPDCLPPHLLLLAEPLAHDTHAFEDRGGSVDRYADVIAGAPGPDERARVEANAAGAASRNHLPDHVHLGHQRLPQGRAADPSQPAQPAAGAGAVLAARARPAHALLPALAP